MREHFVSTITKGMDAFSRRIQEKKRLYAQLLTLAAKNDDEQIYRITQRSLFHKTLRVFAPALDHTRARIDLQTIYDIAIHKPTGALIIANRGATLYALSPRTQTPHITRHIGCCIYMPGLGIEFVNVGIVGNVYDGKVVLRSESACSPSFLFGSQRCNCAHQWESIREVAAGFNKIRPPKTKNGAAFERWVQRQCSHARGHHSLPPSAQGFLMLHVDTQNGMGSGYSRDEFSFDLFTRASMRHRGEYSSEQIAGVTMAGGFAALGLRPDPRQEREAVGYQVTRVVLDFLGVSRDIIFLTNNTHKLRALSKNGYRIQRVKSIGSVNAAGAQEANQRGSEFHHLDIDGKHVSFSDEIRRLSREIRALTKA